MTNKRIRKLLQNSQGRSKGQELSNRELQDEHETQETESNSPVETHNDDSLESHQQDGEFNEEDSNEITSSSQKQPKRRGKTVMKDVHALRPDQLLVVQFNERGQPYGELQATLANYVGTIARNGNLLPLGYLDWRKIPKHRLDDAWKAVLEHFSIHERHRTTVMQNMGAAWRRWRNEVKAKSYDSNTPLQELVCIRPVPHGLSPEVWEALCNYWKSTEGISKINRENANKKKGTHAQGRTNIPSLEHKFLQENGRKPSRIEIMSLSRKSKKKGGALVDDEAIRHENLLDEAVQRRLKDMPEGTQAIEVHEEAFREVFGSEHSGRVRCLGAGALPSQVFPELCKRRSIYMQGFHSTPDDSNRFKEMEEKMKDMEARQAQRQAEMEAQHRIEMEQMMRQHREQQLHDFTRIMQTMLSGDAGGSSEPELLPAKMAAMMANIMKQNTSTTNGSMRKSPPPP